MEPLSVRCRPQATERYSRARWDFQPEDEHRKPRLIIRPSFMVDKSTGPIEGDRLLVGPEDLDEDRIM